jgi:hypothetical protein
MASARSIAVRAVVGALALAGLVAATIQARPYNQRPYLRDNLYLPSGKFVEQTSLGYPQVAADLVWFSAIQYYGGYRQAHHSLAYFEGLIDIVTDLDPHFIFPYIFGAVVMSQDMGEFPRAAALLKKGMARNPTRWELPFEIGFLAYVDARDNATAAQYFELAARLPGGGDRARRFAAFVYSQAGHAHNAIRMWEELAEESDEPFMRELARHYLERLRAEQAAAQGRRDL